MTTGLSREVQIEIESAQAEFKSSVEQSSVEGEEYFEPLEGGLEESLCKGLYREKLETQTLGVSLMSQYIKLYRSSNAREGNCNANKQKNTPVQGSLAGMAREEETAEQETPTGKATQGG